MTKFLYVIALTVLFHTLTSCSKLLPGAPKDNEILDGPVEGLSQEEMRQFVEGDIAFNDEVFTPESGLGPLFVATSCGSCHAGDGKGHPFSTLTRFGQSDTTGNKFMHLGGPQLQNRAVPGYTPEQIPAGATFARFTPPANTGLGFLEALSDEAILSNADPYDADGDGISGVPNYITPPAYFQPGPNQQEFNGRFIGRFGKKAAAINLLHQTVNAYNQDMGVSSLYSPIDTHDGQEIDPEIGTATVNRVVFYLATLKAPQRRNADSPEVKEGEQLFSAIKCAKCHLPELKTGPYKIPALSNKTFSPYSDLLLHDMGPGLDDKYTEGNALTSEWRTPPLWGLGLSKNSQGGQYFLLHDGRARSIEEAILLHGGEAESSRNQYKALPETDRKKLLTFLESL